MEAISMDLPAITCVILVILTFTGLVFLLVRQRDLRRRYGAVIDIDEAVAKARSDLEQLTAERERVAEAHTKDVDALDAEYRKAKTTYDNLKHEIGLLEENLEDISFGVYKPHFDYQTPDAYKAALTDIREQQKSMIRADRAAHCDVQWTVGGSRSEGARMQKQYSKLLLRAFNGECEAAVANVAWNNAVRMEERIAKSFDAINKLGGVMKISITAEFRDLKLAELRLKHEYEEKLHAEKEEQRHIREQMREDERAQRELERAREDAEEEATRSEQALAKARAEVTLARGAEVDKLNDRIKILEERLRLAQEQKERAISRAQLTRSGHVYIISNMGSFGERVMKIGLTRRLEPLERIRELSDASVPFGFDVHAILYSEDAPSLEAAFHQAFEEKRINLVNARKEFFSVTVEEIEEFMRARGLNVVLTKLAEARDYRQTLALRNKKVEPVTCSPATAEAFPDSLRAGAGVGSTPPASS